MESLIGKLVVDNDVLAGLRRAAYNELIKNKVVVHTCQGKPVMSDKDVKNKVDSLVIDRILQCRKEMVERRKIC